MAVYGSQVAQASTEPLVSASLVSAGGRKRIFVSSGFSPADANAFSVTKWPIEPRFVPMLLPLRSAAVFSGESGRTRMAVP
ncbi:hypothetical protein D3C85_1592790 [compost metagenome]